MLNACCQVFGAMASLREPVSKQPAPYVVQLPQTLTLLIAACRHDVPGARPMASALKGALSAIKAEYA